MRYIHAEFGVEIGFVLSWSWNSSVTLPYTRYKGGITMATIFWTKIAINAYKCISARDNEDAITHIRGFCGQTVQVRHCEGLSDVAMAAKFWPRCKNTRKWP